VKVADGVKGGPPTGATAALSPAAAAPLPVAQLSTRPPETNPPLEPSVACEKMGGTTGLVPHEQALVRLSK